jgi:hypothetical protein
LAYALHRVDNVGRLLLCHKMCHEVTANIPPLYAVWLATPIGCLRADIALTPGALLLQWKRLSTATINNRSKNATENRL